MAYDGRSFMGSQRQPGLRTVEGDLIRSLEAIGAMDSPSGSRFKMASRTDRGVSAMGNVAAFDTEFPREQLLRALNAQTEDIQVHSMAVVPEIFSPRRARSRWYRYTLPSAEADVTRMMDAASIFRGKHDFSMFCRRDGRVTLRTIHELDTLPVGDFLVIDIRAREFLWNMVRRLVAAIHSVGMGDSTLEDIQRALDGDEMNFGLAPAHNLCLMDVEYSFPFQKECPDTLERKLRSREERSFIDLGFYRALLDMCRED